MMKTRTRGKRTIDRGLQGSVGTLVDMNSTRLSKRSQGCPLTDMFHEVCDIFAGDFVAVGSQVGEIYNLQV